MICLFVFLLMLDIFDFSTLIDEYSGKEKQEKLVISEDCNLITLVSVVQGRLEVTTTHVYFFDLSPVKEEGLLKKPIRFINYNVI